MSRLSGPPTLDPRQPIAESAARSIGYRIDELLALERHIRDPLRVAELHEMRIAAKRLRYTMEIFAPLYGKEFAAAIEKVKSIQEQLGSIHDADVLVPEIVAHIRRELRPADGAETQGVFGVDLDETAALIALCRRCRKARQDTYRAFIRDWRLLRRTGFFATLRALRVVGDPPQTPSLHRTGGRHDAGKQPEAKPAQSEPVL